MAGPISHVVYAEKALRTFLKDKNEHQFIVGNLFPDIRALKVIDRNATHFQDVTLEDIQQEANAFKAGMLFHSLIDTTREAFVLKNHAYDNLPDSYLSTVALKICEDTQLYARIHDWQTYINYLQEILPQEKQFGIPITKLQEWHDIHRTFLANPSFADNLHFFSSLGFNQEQIAELGSLVEKITQSRIVSTYLDGFYGNLEQLL